MSHAARLLTVAGALLLVTLVGASFRQAAPSAQTQQPAATTGSFQGASFDSAIDQNAKRMIEEGRKDLSLRHIRQRGVLG